MVRARVPCSLTAAMVGSSRVLTSSTDETSAVIEKNRSS
jgi:hypothetical protein